MSDARRPPRDMLARLQPWEYEVRESDTGPTLVGHFAVFNQWTEINSAYEGRFMERVAPGAFARTMTNNRGQIKVTFNHGKDPTMGDQVLGIPSVLEEDDRGARYEVPLFEGIPPLLLDGLRHNAYGSSFRFRVVNDDWNDKAKKSATNPEGLPERTIREAQVFEFGPVTYPAYAGASAGVRSITDDYLLTILRDALPHDGPEAEPHSDEGTRDEEAPPPPPAEPAITNQDPPKGGSSVTRPKFISQEDFVRQLQQE